MISAFIIASKRGYPFIDTRGGKASDDGKVWLSAFRQNEQRTGPTLYVGFDDFGKIRIEERS